MPIVLSFPECHINEIVQYEAFIPLSIMLLRFIPVVPPISHLFSFITLLSITLPRGRATMRFSILLLVGVWTVPSGG